MDPLKTQPQPEAKLHFLDYWRIIRIRKTVILTVFLLVFVTATLVTYILPKGYESTARIKIEANGTDIAPMIGSQTYGNLPYDPYFIATEFEVIKSELILKQVISLLNLDVEWGTKYNNGVPLKMPEAIKLLQNRLTLSPDRNTKLVKIRVTGPDKNETTKIANTIADVYRDYRMEERRTLAFGGIQALEDRYKKQEALVSEIQHEADQLRTNLDISDIDAQFATPAPSLEAETLRKYEQERIEYETSMIAAEKLVTNLMSLKPEVLREVLPTTVKDTALSELLSAFNQAEQRLVAMKREYGSAHPEFIRAKEYRDKINEQINNRVNGIMTSLKTQVDINRTKYENLEKRVADARKYDQEKAAKSRPYYDKKRELESAIRFREILKLKIESEKIDMNLPKNVMVTITDRATVPDEASWPPTGTIVVLSAIAGLVVGIALAFFIEYLDTSVKTIDDIERTLQATVLGVIPQNVGSLLDEGSEGAHAEAYRVLRTNLLFSRKDEKLNTVAVVSAGAGEGKSTTVFNLATVFAQSAQRVLIVDSDLRRPTLHKMLRITNNLGLTNYLLKQNTLEEVIQTTQLPTLDFLASGKLPSSSMGILSSSQMKDLISELKRRYDFVFFDSPPIMGVSDASVLASEVDMTVQVIQYRRYPQPMNVRAKQLVEKVGGNLIGIVLNNINMSQDESYYYYSGYYHDYYYYSKSDEATETSTEDKGGNGDSKVEIKQKY